MPRQLENAPTTGWLGLGPWLWRLLRPCA